MRERLSEKDLIRFCLFGILIILATALLARGLTEGLIPIGAESFQEAAVAQHAQRIYYEDTSSVITRHVLVSPYQILLGLFLLAFGSQVTLLLLPGLLIAGFIVYAIKAAYALDINPRSLFLAFIGFALSPALINLGLSFSPELFLLFLISAGIYLSLSDNPFHRMLVYPVMLLLAWSGFIPFMVYIIVLRYAIKINGEDRRRYVLLSFFLGALSALSFLVGARGLLLQGAGLQLFLSKTVTILGGEPGISGFLLLMGSVGFFVTWTMKRRYLLLYGTIFALFLVMAFTSLDLTVYATLLLLPLAVAAFEQLMDRKWQLHLVRRLTLMIIFYGLLFSSIAYGKMAAGAEPGADIITTLRWMESHTDDHVRVFSDKRYGAYIISVAGRDVFLDDRPYFSVNAPKEATYSALFSSRNLKDTSSMLVKENIRYLLITPAMRESQALQGADGLFFLLQNEEYFSRIFTFQDVEVWEYIGPLE